MNDSIEIPCADERRRLAELAYTLPMEQVSLLLHQVI